MLICEHQSQWQCGERDSHLWNELFRCWERETSRIMTLKQALTWHHRNGLLKCIGVTGWRFFSISLYTSTHQHYCTSPHTDIVHLSFSSITHSLSQLVS